jgi:phosphate transport system substrate-binding protein
MSSAVNRAAITRNRHTPYAVASCLLLVVLSGCGGSRESGKEGKKTVRVEGSDTMVNVAQAWAERYGHIRPEISVQVLGNGSGVGIASLIAGNCDLADASREMSATEIKRAKASRGADPKAITVGHDALAIYVHKDNPLDSIAMEDLAEIYGEGGKITKWSQLGVRGPLADQPITRVSRQSSSGTYMYFREKVLGPKRDYRLQSIDQSGSKDVVALVARTPSAIGYSGMGYKTPDVKMLKVSERRGGPEVAPTVENARNHTYPITRSLLIYAIGEPAGAVKEYLDWLRGPDGQKIVAEMGYVPN